jgi:nicotinamidase-related amidase
MVTPRASMKAVKRISVDECCAALIDVQPFFLSQIEKRLRARLTANTKNFVRLLGYFQIPLIVTIERPIDHKGAFPKEIATHLGERAEIHEKDFFDLTRDKAIAGRLARFKKKQVVVAGCETDVCVLQSCLGLLSLGYEVFLVEELLFSSSRNVEAAMARMEAAGAIFVTYKTLFYELVERVEDSRRIQDIAARLGPFPDDLPDAAL